MVTAADFCDYFQLRKKEEIVAYFPRTKREGQIEAALQRFSHLFKTGIWIDEGKVCRWARQHPKQKISALFTQNSLRRKILRHEENMVVEKPSFLSSLGKSLQFFVEFVKDHETIGSLWPSSSKLAKEIVSEIPKDLNAPKRRILEVGPGTGIFTDKIIKRMNPGDELHLVEYDETFCKALYEKYKHIPNVRVIQADFTQHKAPDGEKYDFVVSGLPLNGFRAPFVKKVFKVLAEVTKKNGKISYFEYLFFPKIRQVFLDEQERNNLDEILKVKREFYSVNKLRHRDVYLNFTPARVLHHQMKR